MWPRDKIFLLKSQKKRQGLLESGNEAEGLKIVRLENIDEVDLKVTHFHKHTSCKKGVRSFFKILLLTKQCIC